MTRLKIDVRPDTADAFNAATSSNFIANKQLSTIPNVASCQVLHKQQQTITFSQKAEFAKAFREHFRPSKNKQIAMHTKAGYPAPSGAGVSFHVSRSR